MTTATHTHPALRTRPTPYLTVGCLAALSVLCLFAYATSFRGALVYDDLLCLVQRGGLNEWWPTEKFSTGRRRWLTHLTFVANYKLHGYWVPGYHGVNLAIHLGAGLCLFGLVRRTLLLPATRERFAPAAPWLALAAAAIWLVHPLQTESVTYVVQRLESLAGMLFLLTLYLVLRGSQSHFAVPWYLGAVAIVWIGTGSKETMFLAPIAVLFYDRVYLASSWRELWQRRWGLHAATLPALAWSAYWLKACFTPGTQSSMGFGFRGITPWEYLRTQPEVILHYLRLTFWPAEQCLDYGWRIQDDPWMIYGCGAIVVTMLGLSLAASWYRPRVGFVAMMFFLMLAPTSSFMPIRDLAFEHRMYLPLASVVLLLVLALYGLFQRWPSTWLGNAVPAVLCLVAVLGLTWRTIDRNRLYHDPVDVWREVSERSPWHARGAYNLGESLVKRGMTPGGRRHYRHLQLHHPPALAGFSKRDDRVNLAGDIAEAMEWFRTAAQLDPQDASPHFNLAGLYDRAQHPAEAIEHYRRTLQLNPAHLSARMNLARLLGASGNATEARAHFRKAIELAPRDPRPQLNFGKMLATAGLHAEALEHFRAALRLQPRNPSARFQESVSLWQIGEQRAAIAQLRELRREQRHLQDVNLTLARYLAETSEREVYNPAEGAAIAQEILTNFVTPPAEAFAVVALCQLELARYDEAAATIQRGLQSANPNADARHVQMLQALQERLPAHVHRLD